MTAFLRRCAAALAVAALPVATAIAQAPDPAMLAAERAAMAKFAWMDGTWRGPAVTKVPGGEHRVTQTERIGPMLDGTIRVLEGKGFNLDGSVGFNAFATISYNPATKNYTLHSNAQGRVGDFPITPTADGYVWEIPAGPTTIRYTAMFASGSWHEVGDRVTPGQPPVRFFEMTLTRVGDTSWPAAGGLPPQ